MFCFTVLFYGSATMFCSMVLFYGSALRFCLEEMCSLGFGVAGPIKIL